MLDKFTTFFEEFKNTKLWIDMVNCTEDSCYHREASVAIHTQMVIDHYLANFASYRSPRQQALTLLSILFHDTGKPAAMHRKFTEKRGDHNSFGGHEQKSARLFENYMAQHYFKWMQLKKTFSLRDTDLYVITWIIENHLPHNFGKPDMRQRICDQLNSAIFDDGDLADVYFDQLISDQSGRISDAQAENLAEVYEFIEDVKTSMPTTKYDAKSRRELVLLVGASGSGKSTMADHYIRNGYNHISLDDHRLSFGRENGITTTLIGEAGSIDMYAKCYEYCDHHRSTFNRYTNTKFAMAVEQYQHIVVDNTNVSRKARSGYISKAKDHGYKVIAVTFPIERTKLIKRAESRTDKKVPIGAVLLQYDHVTMPWICEDGVDEIIVNISNFDTGNL